MFWGLFHMHPQIEASMAQPVLGPAFQRETHRQWFWRLESWEGASSTQRGHRHSPVGGDAEWKHRELGHDPAATRPGTDHSKRTQPCFACLPILSPCFGTVLDSWERAQVVGGFCLPSPSSLLPVPYANPARVPEPSRQLWFIPADQTRAIWMAGT